MRSRRSRRAGSTPGCSPSTSRGSGSFGTPGRPASPRAMGAFLAQADRRGRVWIGRTLSRRTSARRRPVRGGGHPERFRERDRRHRAEPRCRSSSVSHSARGCSIQISTSIAAWTRDVDRGRRHRHESPVASQTTFARTICTATTATASSSRCVTSAGIRRSCRRSPSCSRKMRRPSPSSTAATTASCRSPTPSFSTNGCPTAGRIIERRPLRLEGPGGVRGGRARLDYSQYRGVNALITSPRAHKTAETLSVDAGGAQIAYRRFGSRAELPLVMLQLPRQPRCRPPVGQGPGQRDRACADGGFRRDSDLFGEGVRAPEGRLSRQ